MTKPELAGDGLGLELWRLLIREHEAPEQPVFQREFQRRWAYPKRCRGASELWTPVSYTHLRAHETSAHL
eukprot:1749154-Alexandrium_andersonii.AAC.1